MFRLLIVSVVAQVVDVRGRRGAQVVDLARDRDDQEGEEGDHEHEQAGEHREHGQRVREPPLGHPHRRLQRHGQEERRRQPDQDAAHCGQQIDGRDGEQHQHDHAQDRAGREVDRDPGWRRLHAAGFDAEGRNPSRCLVAVAGRVAPPTCRFGATATSCCCRPGSCSRRAGTAGDDDRLPAAGARADGLAGAGGRGHVRPARPAALFALPGRRGRRPLRPPPADDRGRRGAGVRHRDARRHDRSPVGWTSGRSRSSRSWRARAPPCSPPPRPGRCAPSCAPPSCRRPSARRRRATPTVRLGGPPLGGVLFELGRAVPFLVDAVSYAARWRRCARCARRSSSRASPTGRACAPRSARASASCGSRPFLRACAFLFALGNFTLPGIFLVIVVVGRGQGLGGGAIGAALRGLRRRHARSARSPRRSCAGRSRCGRSSGSSCGSRSRSRVPGLAERLRARGRDPAAGLGDPGDELGGRRLPRRRDARPPARPGRERCAAPSRS